MRYLLLADVHSNLEALQAVLKDAKKKSFRRILCLGDMVGYNADPNECLEILSREPDAILLMGNHDAAAAGLLSLEQFNPGAAECIKWTQKKLTEENKVLLKNLPYFFSNEFMLACHASPRDYLWEYMDSNIAKESLQIISEQLLVVGHVHEAFYFQAGRKVASFVPENAVIDFSKKRTVVSLPAVGQPRDSNPKTGYAFLDLNKKKIEIKRIPYNAEAAAEKVRKAGLPKFEAERLLLGR